MLNERIGSYTVRCTEDHRNYVLVKHGEGKTPGVESERDIGYYNGLDGCLRELARREADMKGTILEWLSEYRRVLEELQRAF